MTRTNSTIFSAAAVFALLLNLPAAAWGQADCDGYRYRYKGAFDSFNVDYDLPYGENINWMLLSEELVADVYTPSEQSDELRPLVLMAHGGFFLGGSHDGLDVVSLCEDLAQMGYVTASFSYRLGIDNLFAFQTSFVEAVWRGVHDSRAAVRYFRKSVEMGNPYHIDPERIYLGGVSAGGFIAMHHAYVDDVSEIPTYIDESEPGLGGGLEGLSGNDGYSSDIDGVFNIAGALQTADFLLLGDNEPLVSIHGTADETVPFDEGEIVLTGIPIIDVDGSSVVHDMADMVGLENCLIPVEGAGHVPHIFDETYYDLTLSTVAGKLGEWACEGYVPVCGGYDYTAKTSVSDLSTMQPLLFPNPASAQGRVFASFEARSEWTLVNALGAVVERGVAQAGDQVAWSGLAPGWYALRSSAGSQALVVQP
jgi:hypothetical protein